MSVVNLTYVISKKELTLEQEYDLLEFLFSLDCNIYKFDGDIHSNKPYYCIALNHSIYHSRGVTIADALKDFFKVLCDHNKLSNTQIKQLNNILSRKD